jgi:hypothetical protein
MFSFDSRVVVNAGDFSVLIGIRLPVRRGLFFVRSSGMQKGFTSPLDILPVRAYIHLECLPKKNKKKSSCYKAPWIF